MRSPEAAIASIPGWETATWTALAGGISNSSFLLQNEGRRAVLKIDDAPREAPFNMRRSEFEIQSRAARAMLANEPLYADETVYLSEYVEGQVWSTVELRDSANLRLLAVALRELHALPLTGRSFDALGAAEDYAGVVAPNKSAEASQHLDRIERTSSTATRCFCHNDLVAENILITDRLRFLDWEYACDNDPLFDLATVITHHGLAASHTEILLSAYFGQRFDDDRVSILQHLAAQARLYESLHWLWDVARG